MRHDHCHDHLPPRRDRSASPAGSPPSSRTAAPGRALAPGPRRSARRPLDVGPVRTGLPTESARRTSLDLQARVAEGRLAGDGGPEPQRRAIEGRLEGEVELLWLTEEVRRDRPSVMDEVSNALWYL